MTTTAPNRQTEKMNEALQQAQELRQNAKLAAAKRICLKQLKELPNDPETLHLLGLIELQSGMHEPAVNALEKAVAGSPGNALWLAELSDALESSGKHLAALEHIDAALALAPSDVSFLLRRAGRLKSLGRFYEALKCYEHLLTLEPSHAEALLSRGVLLERFGQLDRAAESYRNAIAADPSNSKAHSWLCIVLSNLGLQQEALTEYDRLLELDPGNATEWFNRGNVLNHLGKLQEAVESYEKAVALAPKYADAWYNRGNSLYALQHFDEALKSFERTVEIDPNYTMGWLNRGNALLELFRPKEALECFERAIALQPDYAEAWMNRGNACADLGWMPQAAESCAKALDIRPDYSEARFNLALATLRQGNFRDGWRLYECRWQQREWHKLRRNFSQPLWLGNAPVAGKTLLLHAEQGLGDTIQFCRHATEVARLGTKVILQVQAPLVALLKQLDGVAQVLSMEEALPPFDMHCPIVSLPLVLGSGTTTPIFGTPYLKADKKKKAEWAQRLGNKTKPRIGIVWSGNTKFPGDRKRSLSAEQLLPHLPEGFDYICLQKELKEQDKEAVANSPIRFFGDELHDFTDTAALCSLMELVVTSCTSMAHLSGALGMPTWVMLQFNPDFRWLRDRSDTPWYDSVRLFRQPKLGDWQGVFEQLHEALLQHNGWG